ncbi:hypothetical protein CPC08DRAFT_761198 [Agrocybe pediades]|nr:hypothetical protein CPC08DRAFT_761198 [Agrocybe pediades]
MFFNFFRKQLAKLVTTTEVALELLNERLDAAAVNGASVPTPPLAMAIKQYGRLQTALMLSVLEIMAFLSVLCNYQSQPFISFTLILIASRAQFILFAVYVSATSRLSAIFLHFVGPTVGNMAINLKRWGLCMVHRVVHPIISVFFGKYWAWTSSYLKPFPSRFFDCIQGQTKHHSLIPCHRTVESSTRSSPLVALAWKTGIAFAALPILPCSVTVAFLFVFAIDHDSFSTPLDDEEHDQTLIEDAEGAEDSDETCVEEESIDYDSEDGDSSTDIFDILEAEDAILDDPINDIKFLLEGSILEAAAAEEFIQEEALEEGRGKEGVSEEEVEEDAIEESEVQLVEVEGREDEVVGETVWEEVAEEKVPEEEGEESIGLPVEEEAREWLAEANDGVAEQEQQEEIDTGDEDECAQEMYTQESDDSLVHDTSAAETMLGSDDMSKEFEDHLSDFDLDNVLQFLDNTSDFEDAQLDLQETDFSDSSPRELDANFVSQGFDDSEELETDEESVPGDVHMCGEEEVQRVSVVQGKKGTLQEPEQPCRYCVQGLDGCWAEYDGCGGYGLTVFSAAEQVEVVPVEVVALCAPQAAEREVEADVCESEGGTLEGVGLALDGFIFAERQGLLDIKEMEEERHRLYRLKMKEIIQKVIKREALTEEEAILLLSDKESGKERFSRKVAGKEASSTPVSLSSSRASSPIHSTNSSHSGLAGDWARAPTMPVVLDTYRRLLKFKGGKRRTSVSPR